MFSSYGHLLYIFHFQLSSLKCTQVLNSKRNTDVNVNVDVSFVRASVVTYVAFVFFIVFSSFLYSVPQRETRT